MTILQALVLGLVQGLTEYLPVSSSAHLVLLPKIMGWHFSTEEAFIFNVLVQLGTLVGVLAYFFEPLLKIFRSVVYGLIKQKPFHDADARLGWLVVLASIPAAILGLSFKSELAFYFSSAKAACYFLILTAMILILAEFFSHRSYKILSKTDALFIGLAQGLALFPGVSRSGSTIAAGMVRGLSRKDAAFFSFVMSIPVMVGASLLVSIDLFNNGPLIAQMATPLVCGFFSAALSGFLVIKWFMDFVAKRPLYIFAGYCLILGSVGAWYFG